MITDLDKYGLVALTIVVVLILFIAMNDMGEDPDLNLNGVYFTDSDPLETARTASQDDEVVVVDDIGAGAATRQAYQQGEFNFMEAPAQYPGRPATTANEQPNHQNPPSANIHRVERGDTLSLISNRYYGSTKWWKTIADANPGLKPSNLVIGDRIRIPLLEQSAGSMDSGYRPASRSSKAKISGSEVKSRTYRVKNGDTLGKIAKNFYGNAGKWEKIFAANRNKISDPKRLRVGVELDIPR